MDIGFMFRLRDSMHKKGISMSELSRLSGVGKADIHNYLTAKYVAKQDKCYLLAKALDVDPGWLMTGVEPEENNEDRSIVIPDTDMFRKIMENMSYEDLVLVTDAFKRTEEKMKEKGII